MHIGCGTMDAMSTAATSPAGPRPTSPDEGSIRAFTALVGVTSLGVLVLAVLAGGFVNQSGRDGWVTAHGIAADVTVLVALVTAAFAVFRLRATQRSLTLGAVALLVLLVVQTALGHAINDARRLTLIHVPLGMLIFGLAVYLSAAAARLGRGAGTIR